MAVFLWLILLAVVVGGCNRSPQATPANSAPATQNVTTNPATQPTGTALNIDGHEYAFPPAILRVWPSSGHLHARLYTDDPAQAIETNYHGNSFDLTMTLDIPDAGQLSQAVWRYVGSDQSQQHESSRGIFLDGQRQRLHAQSVVLKFNRDADKVDVAVDGWFLQYEDSGKDNAAPAPQRVYVKGDVAATLVVAAK